MTPPLRSLVGDAIQQRVRHIDSLHATASQEAELIHEIRVAAKQFRAHLDLLRDSAGAAFCDREDQALADAARSLAADRDLFVIRQTLQTLARKCTRFSGRHSLHRMLLHLREQRPVCAVRASSLREAGAVLTQSGSAIRRRLHRGLSDAALLEAFRGEYRRARRLTRKCRRQPGKEAWHRWRRQVKALHYQSAALEVLRPRKLSRLARRCWRLQALLGRHHDLHMTRERLSRLRIDPINEQCRKRSKEAIDWELAKLEAKVLHITETFLRPSSKKFAAKLQRTDVG